MKNKTLILSIITALLFNPSARADNVQTVVLPVSAGGPAAQPEPNPAQTHAIVKALRANPCQPVIDACLRAGYIDDHRASGKNLEMDCQYPLVNGAVKSLPGVKGITIQDLANCKNRRQIQSENELKAFFSPVVAMKSSSAPFADPGEVE